MTDLQFRIVDAFPEPAHSLLAREAFSDYEPSALLTEVLSKEAATSGGGSRTADEGGLSIAAFRGDALVGWAYARPEGSRHFHMINSGVATPERRNGIYTELVRRTIEHASARGYVSVQSRHAANNNAVIIAKLKLGFFVSGFEYSEVHGPLVRLTLLLGELRRKLHWARSLPIRRVDDDNA